MFRIADYLKFKLQATNQHGIHSPFVFNYLTRCLYAGKRQHPYKTFDVLLKSISYFGTERLGLVPDDPDLKAMIQAAFPHIRCHERPADLLYLHAPDPELLLAASGINPAIHNHTLCIVDQIHSSREALRNWERVKALEEVRVTIDGYHCGMVFFRKEQAKEHFKIRI